jgi:ABC-type lipoprotein export system ATPase subunit
MATTLIESAASPEKRGTTTPEGHRAALLEERETVQPVARLTGVIKRYETTTALDGLDLALRAGEIVALLGPNGAGKSTAVRLMLGLAAPTSGTVRIFGGDPREATARTRVGAMLQVARLVETLRVREHLDLFRSYYPRPLAVAEIVRFAQLDGLEDRMFGQLSGGQKQRVLFALALCGDPDLIFLDEPTVGMGKDGALDNPLSRRGGCAGRSRGGDQQGTCGERGHAGGDQADERRPANSLPDGIVVCGFTGDGGGSERRGRGGFCNCDGT